MVGTVTTHLRCPCVFRPLWLLPFMKTWLGFASVRLGDGPDWLVQRVGCCRAVVFDAKCVADAATSFSSRLPSSSSWNHSCRTPISNRTADLPHDMVALQSHERNCTPPLNLLVKVHPTKMFEPTRQP